MKKGANSKNALNENALSKALRLQIPYLSCVNYRVNYRINFCMLIDTVWSKLTR